MRSGKIKSRRRTPWGLLLASGLAMAFLYVPIANVVVFSFNSTRSISSFDRPSLTWYRSVLTNDDLLASAWLSTRIAIACAIVAVALGTLLALALSRIRPREAAVPQAVLGLTFTTPEVAMGASLLLLFATAGVPLSPGTITLAHITFSLAYVVFVVRTRLATLRTDIEEAARDLGATAVSTVWLVILPQLRPALLASFALVFLLSFDDFVVSFFTTGVGTPPLPVHIYGMLKRGVTPEVNALGTLMMVMAIVIGFLGYLVVWRRGRKEGSSTVL
ncbi:MULTISPECIES: ABC transporter permease [unclassified Mycolicibacterium]|uniref:ABC transporter permease n=1 Tax=unclassified Mycolicibacterium TaxID=2636767 RepID=UPI0012DE20FC|nr:MULTISPECIES: ABC transporter permease [unclassified Mycolicibacterium]MUL84384.1 ABC transporter permease [Mycolicibacterium sp. CBMA 329]MUL88159.1 ABC transporter permease [Mycolicibacterium sp. CBMA 331]MUM02452.1 ABC transporter permease [Mycolicibacterium sp. CBMA 334]MUM25995.1 ABC transporter permease [Mycolicibacterium sp. CBMA 295]MUM39806.1 ABC transporter permease [Mycolicibacterium sp. CBMA 247]